MPEFAKIRRGARNAGCRGFAKAGGNAYRFLDRRDSSFEQRRSAWNDGEHFWWVAKPVRWGAAYAGRASKKNLIIGFTATPDDHALARFGEYSGYAESEKLWRPFDSYTMKEAIADGFILNPLKNIVPVASKMLFDLPANPLDSFTEREFKDAQKKQVYENRERIDAISRYVADLLVKDV